MTVPEGREAVSRRLSSTLVGPPAFDIRERMAAMAGDIVEAYRPVSTATLGHLFDGRAMDGGLRPLVPGARAVGCAVTMRTLGRDSTACHKVIDLVGPGDVLVVDRGGDTRYACWGEMMTLAAKCRGAAGVVIDGPATDLDAIRRLDFPVFARGTAPLTTLLLAQGGAINVPVSCGGVEVEPGELILADDDGILVLDPDEAAALLAAVLREDREDSDYRDALLSGKLPSELVPIDRMIEEANRA